MPINLHIQIPNFILRNFRNSATGRVYHLDLTGNSIRSCSSDKLGAEYGYYSAEMEQYLNGAVENPFSKLAADVTKLIDKKQPYLEIPLTAEDICKRYISAAMYRSRLALDILMQGSITAPDCSDQENHDDLVFWGMQHNHGVFPQLADHEMLVIINRTEERFVVPRNCFFEVSSHKVKCIVAPIAPNCALCLAPKKYRRDIISDTESRVGFLDDPEDVYVSNHHALRYEYIFNRGFVAAANRSELERLSKYLDSREPELEKLRTDAMSQTKEDI